ncbi:hypothetical protein J1N35_018896, partial [Gossypium stocksii]
RPRYIGSTVCYNSLMNAQKKPDTLINNHMITLMGYFSNVIDNEVNLDQNTRIEMVFKRLTKCFVSFRDAYNLGNKNLILTQLKKELQFNELMLNGSQSIQRAKANIAIISSSKRKGKHTKKGKAKVSKPPEVERKRINLSSTIRNGTSRQDVKSGRNTWPTK